MQAYSFPFFIEHVSGVPKSKLDVWILTLALAARIVLIAFPIFFGQIAGTLLFFPRKDFVDKYPRTSGKEPDRFLQPAPILHEQFRQNFPRLIGRRKLVTRNFLPFFTEQQRRFLVGQ